MSPERRETLLKIDNVSQVFGENVVLRGVNAEIKNIVRADRPDIQQGQVVCLLGPSGVGKTQLFRIMAGVLKPTRGRGLLGAGGKAGTGGGGGGGFSKYPFFK